jgi:hypothetical protein
MSNSEVKHFCINVKRRNHSFNAHKKQKQTNLDNKKRNYPIKIEVSVFKFPLELHHFMT